MVTVTNVVSSSPIMFGETGGANKEIPNLSVDLAKPIQTPVLAEPMPDAQQHAVFSEDAVIEALDELMVKLDKAFENPVDEEVAIAALDIMIAKLENALPNVENSEVLDEVEITVGTEQELVKNDALDEAHTALLKEAGEKKTAAYKAVKNALIATILAGITTLLTSGGSLSVFILSAVVLVATIASALLAKVNFSRAEKGEEPLSGAEFLKHLLVSGMKKIGLSETVVDKVQDVSKPFKVVVGLVEMGFDVAKDEHEANAADINAGNVIKGIAELVVPGLVPDKKEA